MKLFSLLCFLMILAYVADAQQIIIKGIIKDSTDFQVIENVHIRSSVDHSFSDLNGEFILSSIYNDNLTFSHTGYKEKVIKINAKKDTTIEIFLNKNNFLLEEINIVAKENNRIQLLEGISKVNIPLNKIENNPVILGEKDVLKAFQQVPGVLSSAEGQSHLIVRGGSADQNLFLFGNSIIYNPHHLFGFVSVFDPDILQSAEIYKSNFPIEYGGKVSSIVNLQLRDGDKESYKFKANIGLLSGKLLVEGPLQKGKSSFLFSARKSLTEEVFLKLYRQFASSRNDFKNYNLNFYDTNAHLNFQIGNNNKIVIHNYSGSDSYYRIDRGFENNRNIDNSNGGSWKNNGTSISWLQKSKNFTNNYILDYSRYFYENEIINKSTLVTGNQNFVKVNQDTGVKDLTLRIKSLYTVSPIFHFKFGTSLTNHHLNQGTFHVTTEFESQKNEYEFENGRVNSYESSVFSGVSIDPSTKINIDGGFNLMLYTQNNTTKTYFQPRIQIQYAINKAFVLTSSISKNAQNIQTLKVGRNGLPNELWISNIDALTSVQFDLNMSYYSENYNFSLGSYYKNFNNLLNLIPGNSVIDLAPLEDKFMFASGKAYGLELFLGNQFENFTNELSYTLSSSKIRLDNINMGNFFPSNFDRRHNLFYNLTWKVSNKIQFVLTWQFSSGRPIIISKAQYFSLSEQPVNLYSSRGELRERNFHTANFNFNYSFQKNKWNHQLSFGVYNLYNRRNPFYTTTYREESTDNGTTTQQLMLRSYSLFPIIPSLNYSIVL